MFPTGIEGGLEKGCLAFSRSNVSLVLGAIPFDVRIWQALENRPSLAQEMADFSFAWSDSLEMEAREIGVD